MNPFIKHLILALVVAFAPLAPARAGWHHCGGGHGGFSIGIGGFAWPFFYGGYAPSYYAPYYSAPAYGPYYYGGAGSDLAMSAAVQRELARRGFYYGGIDGLIGPMSRDAIRRYQATRGLPVTGRIDYPLLRSLGLQ